MVNFPEVLRLKKPNMTSMLQYVSFLVHPLPLMPFWPDIPVILEPELRCSPIVGFYNSIAFLPFCLLQGFLSIKATCNIPTLIHTRVDVERGRGLKTSITHRAQILPTEALLIWYYVSCWMGRNSLYIIQF